MTRRGVGDRCSKAVGRGVGSWDMVLGERLRTYVTLRTCWSAFHITYFTGAGDQRGFTCDRSKQDGRSRGIKQRAEGELGSSAVGNKQGGFV